VLEGLHLREVRTLALGETVVAVEQQLGRVNGSELVGRLALLPGVEHAVLVLVCHHPCQVLDGVVEVQAHVLALLRGVADRHVLVAGELQLLDEVLVRVLCIALALVAVEVDVVAVESCGGRVGAVDAGNLACVLKVNVELP